MITLNEFLTCFIQRMNESSIEHCVLRNYDGLPKNNPGNDIDFLILPNKVNKVMKILSSIGSIVITGITNRYYVSSIFIYGISWGNRKTAIQIDLVTSLSWKGLNYLNSEDVYNKMTTVPFSENLINKPSPYHEAIISFFSSYLLGGWIKDRYQKEVKNTFTTYNIETKKILEKKLGEKTAQKLVTEVINDNRDRTLKLLPAVKYHLFLRSFFKSPVNTLENILKHYLIEIKIRFTPYPITSICFLGADGAGKSAVISALTKQLAGTAKEITYIHLKPTFKKNNIASSQQTIVDNPHSLPPRSAFTSLTKLIWWLILYWYDAFCHCKKTSTLKIWDRYYYDIYIDPKRYRYGAPIWVAKLIGKLIPRPSLTIVLDAPAEIIQARKQEVSMEETKRQRIAYLQFAKETPNTFVLNTGQSFSLTKSEGIKIVLSHMKNKQAIKDI